VQRLRRLVRDAGRRRAEQVFVIEGVTAVAEALDAGIRVEVLFAAPGAPAELVERAAAAGATVDRLAPGVLERAVDTVTPPPVVALLPWTDVPLSALQEATLVVVAVGVSDPGNAGTLLRSARAAGVDGVVSCAGSVDVFNPKTVRAAAGSLFHSQVVSGGDPVEVLEQLGRWGLRRLGTVARGGTPHDQVDLRRPVALVLGNESHGLPPGVGACVDEVVSVPMAPGVESLNVGVAAAVMCFEARRQRGWSPQEAGAPGEQG
jgi:TrmH family RNA methyltransferase